MFIRSSFSDCKNSTFWFLVLCWNSQHINLVDAVLCLSVTTAFFGVIITGVFFFSFNAAQQFLPDYFSRTLEIQSFFCWSQILQLC